MHTNNILRAHAGKLMLGCALAAFAAAPTVVFAQNETVTVTGTSIRGQAPIGANVISVDRNAIEASEAQTTQQLLQTIPQVNNSFGNSGQGTIGSADASGTQAPTIHSLGNSASNGTLILIDGRRLPLSGVDHTLADPSIIPAAAIQRVEVLPDGASAIYGSDAVAGVLNFITRKNYTGWETSVQAGVADHYNTFNFSQLFGHAWEGGSVLAVYNYSNRSNLMNRERDFITARQDLRMGAADPSLFTGINPTPPAGTPVGTPYPSLGSNFQNFNCPVATIANNNTAVAYQYPYTAGTGISVTQTNPNLGVCDVLDSASSLPSELRNSALFALSQKLNDRMALSVDVIYSSRLGSSRSSRGSISGTAFRDAATGGTGGPAFGTGQRNPFYVSVPGSTANSQFIRMNFDELLPGYASGKTGSTTAMSAVSLEYDFGGEWFGTLGTTLGTDLSFIRNQGSINSAQAFLALNGTVNANGTANNSPTSSAIADPYGLGTVASVTRTLTTANALDVWRPKETNRTSDAVLRSILDSPDQQTAVQGLQNVQLKFDGPVTDLPAGPIKAAFGAEWAHYTFDLRNTLNSAGPASTSSRFVNLKIARTVYAAYAEFVIPIIGADMDVPLMRGLTLDIAGRYDQYTDFGSTKNPKISFDWDIVEGLRGRGSFGTSFTAPAMTSSGAQGTGLTGGTSLGGGGAQNNLTVLFNTTIPYNNFAGIAGTWVSTAASCAAAGSTVVDAAGNSVAAASPLAVGCRVNSSVSTGISINGGRPDLKPEIGMTYSGGFDINFGAFLDELSGLTTSVTYYQAKFAGLVTNIGTNTSLPQLTTFAPIGGWDPNDPTIQSLTIGRPLLAPLPARVWSIFDSRQQNAFTIWQNGLDFEINYRFSTDTMGDFSFGVAANQIFRFSQKNGDTGAVVSIKNGNNGGRFTGQELTGRISASWRMAPFSLGFGVSHIKPYNANMTQFPYNFAGPNRRANTYHIGPLWTLDMNAAYDLPDEWMEGTQLSLNVSNLLDTTPPFANSTSGFGTGSQIGRIVTVSLRKKW